VTDRDIVVDVVARGVSPDEVPVGTLVRGETVTIGADDSLEEAHRTMAEHQVRRLPVIDGDRLVGIVSMADVAQESPESATGRTERAVTE
jgi:CBS domain-containing protein